MKDLIIPQSAKAIIIAQHVSGPIFYLNYSRNTRKLFNELENASTRLTQTKSLKNNAIQIKNPDDGICAIHQPDVHWIISKIPFNHSSDEIELLQKAKAQGLCLLDNVIALNDVIEQSSINRSQTLITLNKSLPRSIFVTLKQLIKSLNGTDYNKNLKGFVLPQNMLTQLNKATIAITY